MLHHLQVRSTLPTEEQLVALLPSKYSECQVRVAKILAEQARFVSLTVDCVALQSGEQLLLICAHFVSQQWKRHQVCLNVSHVQSNCTESIRNAIQHAAKSWGLGDRITTVMLDNDVCAHSTTLPSICTATTPSPSPTLVQPSATCTATTSTTTCNATRHHEQEAEAMTTVRDSNKTKKVQSQCYDNRSKTQCWGNCCLTHP
jgi:hypothetical protein